jgi:hypothetical protein
MAMPAVSRKPVAPAAPRRSRRLRTILIAVGVVAVGCAVALTVALRVESGEWQIPDLDDVQRIVFREPGPPARTIFLERRPVTIYPGDNDSGRAMSSVLRNVREKAASTKPAPGKAASAKPPPDPSRPAKLPGWKGSEQAWRQVVSCVAALFAPFNVTVTDRPPPEDEHHVLVAVGGKPGDLGVTDGHVAGLAPFNGAVIAKPVVFAFSAQLGNSVRQVCETIGMEVAHAYGLDHAYLCSDVMTYLRPCGAKKFVDKAVPCGEGKPRTCEGGKPTQNSYRFLMEVLGPKPPAPKAGAR